MAYNDILLDEVTQDLVVDTGDFRIGDATNQLQYYLIASAPGHIKEFPLVGGNIYQYLNGTATPIQIETELSQVLTADVFPDAQVDASGFPVIIINQIEVKL